MPYIGEIRIFAGNFAPSGWAFCEGQQVPIAENDALFVVLGTRYGGDAETYFNLPDLRGRAPMHQGNGHIAGEASGIEEVTLTVTQIPGHTHTLLASSDTGTLPDPGNHVPARSHTANVDLYIEDNPISNMSVNAISPIGGSQPHTNLQPYLCLNFIISLYGVFPSQT